MTLAGACDAVAVAAAVLGYRYVTGRQADGLPSAGQYRVMAAGLMRQLADRLAGIAGPER